MDTTTRAGAVANWIRERIVNGVFEPEMHLQEQALANQTGTSRTPVREALKLLEREQFVVYSPNRGYVVRRFSLKDILDAFDVRATLEGMVCRIVAERGLSLQADAFLQDIEKEMETVAFATTWGDRESLRWFDLNFSLHRKLLSEADNSMLASAIEQSQRLPLIFDSSYHLRNASQVSRLFGPEDTQRSHRDHVQILEAVRKGQATRAEFAMREHIFQSREAIRHNFASAYPDKDSGQLLSVSATG